MMRGRFRVAGGVLAVCAAALIVGMGAAPPTIDFPMLQEEIQRELPAGTSVDQVLAFLDAYHLKHSGLVSPMQVIYAVVHARQPIGKGWTTGDAVELQFWFGLDNRLVNVAVREYDPAA